jgi:hypothetical protein
MKTRTHHGLILAALGLGLLATGCASPNVNPSQPRPHTGYVDFHSDSGGLSWGVSRFDDRTQKFKQVCSELQPPPGGILRLTFPPGRYRFRVAVLNRVIVEPVELEIEIQEGHITPVRVTLTEAGASLVRTKEGTHGSTPYVRTGRRTKIGYNETARYSLSAVALPPVDYEVKERMPYAR